MTLPQPLLKILVCPVDKGWLMYFADEDLLYNPRLRRGYRIEEGIPMMLAERAEPVPEREHERLIARARDGAAAVSIAGMETRDMETQGMEIQGVQTVGLARNGYPGNGH